MQEAQKTDEVARYFIYQPLVVTCSLKIFLCIRNKLANAINLIFFVLLHVSNTIFYLSIVPKSK